MSEGLPEPEHELTSTQKGAVGEVVVAAGLMLASGGQLSPYRPVADDDGIDLLLVDKGARNIVQLQVKARTNVDSLRAGTVQFDIRRSTFVKEASKYVLAVLLDGPGLRKAWLIPFSDLETVARPAVGKLVVVASVRDDTSDRFAKYRHDDFKSVARKIMDDNVAPV